MTGIISESSVPTAVPIIRIKHCYLILWPEVRNKLAFKTLNQNKKITTKSYFPIRIVVLCLLTGHWFCCSEYGSTPSFKPVSASISIQISRLVPSMKFMNLWWKIASFSKWETFKNQKNSSIGQWNTNVLWWEYLRTKYHLLFDMAMPGRAEVLNTAPFWGALLL